MKKNGNGIPVRSLPTRTLNIPLEKQLGWNINKSSWIVFVSILQCGKLFCCCFHKITGR